MHYLLYNYINGVCIVCSYMCLYTHHKYHLYHDVYKLYKREAEHTHVLYLVWKPLANIFNLSFNHRLSRVGRDPHG